ncbi:MAG: hypothetical protein SO135_00085 [Sphaerochaetaceae bacterium]|jgi:hypothetical protein|nr:hypothetical protein [Sphaerochaetaceae bacterium]NLY07933.1 hypothetical protein [Spirochaetales bacterium]
MKLCKAIVFNSNTGFSESYARMLSDETGIPVFSLKQACHHLSKGDEVFFLGWVMGSRIMGLAKARKQFNLAGIASVGMINEEKAIAEIRKANGIADDYPFFFLHGGLAIERLHGIYRLLFKLAVNTIKRTASTPTDSSMETYKMMTEGASFISMKNLRPVISWISRN